MSKKDIYNLIGFAFIVLGSLFFIGGLIAVLVNPTTLGLVFTLIGLFFTPIGGYFISKPYSYEDELIEKLQIKKDESEKRADRLNALSELTPDNYDCSCGYYEAQNELESSNEDSTYVHNEYDEKEIKAKETAEMIVEAYSILSDKRMKKERRIKKLSNYLRELLWK